jgi:Tfp pilus assembly protein PilO
MTALFYVLTLTLPLATILAAVAMWYRATLLKAQAKLENDDAYNKVIGETASAATATAVALSEIKDALVDVRARLASVEKVLKDVG